jgi:hypothetical protein
VTYEYLIALPPYEEFDRIGPCAQLLHQPEGLILSLEKVAESHLRNLEQYRGYHIPRVQVVVNLAPAQVHIDGGLLVQKQGDAYSCH